MLVDCLNFKLNLVTSDEGLVYEVVIPKESSILNSVALKLLHLTLCRNFVGYSLMILFKGYQSFSTS